jgi:hypothetical protein
MSSGDSLLLFTPAMAEFPSSNYPTFDTRNTVLVLDFDDSTTETCYFRGFMPRVYSGGGLTVTLGWAFTSSGTPGTDTCDWEIAFASVGDDSDDIDTKTFATANTGIATSASADGEVDYYTGITFTDGADMDSVAAGEYFWMSVARDATGGTASPGDAELVFIEIKET